MKNSIGNKLAIFVSTLVISCGAMAGGGSTPEPTPTPTPDPCASGCNFQRGPAPTVNSLEANRGPYNVSTVNVSSYVSGFGGGTIHYPTNAGAGTMGAIAVIPGYVSYESDIKWWGPRIASHGFVVITMNTSSIYDQPNSRATQLSKALDYLISQSNSSSSAIKGMVDSNRLGVIGWSMGGGGSLKLATDRKLNAIIPQAPYYSGSNSFDKITTPTLIIACENDAIASVNSHASPFYNKIPSSTKKAFLEVNNGSHYCGNTGYNEELLGKYGVAWMKRFIDFDSRYSQFLCGPNHTADSDISEYRQNCNY